jgi:hypothetical protein
MTPEAVRTLVDKAGLRVVRHQLGDGAGNFYYERDQIVVVERP